MTAPDVCPLCGQDYIGHLPRHLDGNCPGEVVDESDETDSSDPPATVRRARQVTIDDILNP